MKKVIFIRYINTECEVFTFSSLRKACVFIHNTFNKDNTSYSNNKRREYAARIKASINEDIKYCGGYWIIAE